MTRFLHEGNNCINPWTYSRHDQLRKDPEDLTFTNYCSWETFEFSGGVGT